MNARVASARVVLLLSLNAGALAATGAAQAQSRSNMQQAAEANTQLGLAYMRQGDLQGGRDKIEKALGQDPRNATVQTGAGFLYDRLGDDRRAEQHYTQAVKLSGENPDTVNNLAVFLCRKGDKRKGEEYFLKAAANPLYRTPEVAHTNAGRCARADQRLDDADKHFRRALQLRPNFPDALWQLADLSLEAGRALQARGFLARYLEVAPESPATNWLGYRIETAMSDTEAAERYAMRLRGAYATSDETRNLLQLEQGGRP
jgi:type IV pilus assembly protein PilF